MVVEGVELLPWEGMVAVLGLGLWVSLPVSQSVELVSLSLEGSRSLPVTSPLPGEETVVGLV